MKTKESYKRAFCFFLILTLLTQIIFPTAALALTSGPDQPETQSFEPVGTTEMVDLFTGDFNYNIPLLTVPGPNGGYPVNLAYHAGITPEQEASWVGLGWNLNVGSVNRNMRGLPDDFFGQDIVKKSMTIKPSWTFGLDFKPDVETWGFPATSTVQVGCYYNNYKGVGVRYGFDLGKMKLSQTTVFKKTYNIGVNSVHTDFDSNDGMNIKVKPSFDKSNPEKEKQEKEEKMVMTWLKDFAKRHKKKTEYKRKLAASTAGHGITFANPSFSPKTSFPEGGFDACLWVKFGGDISGLFANSSAKGYLFFQHVKDSMLDYPAYGYLHLGERNRIDDGLAANPDYPNFPGSSSYRPGMAVMDFNRYNDHVIDGKAPKWPVPALTFDIFNATGQGIGMVFRPHRTDIGMVYDPKCSSDFTDAELGLEIGPGPNSAHIGLNPGVSYTGSYEGKWKGQYPDFEKTYEFTNSHFKGNDRTTDDENTIFRSPAYFKSSDDMCISGEGDWKFRGDDLMNFEMASVGDLMDPNVVGATLLDLNFDPANYSLQVFPKIKNQLAGLPTTKVLLDNKTNEAPVRSNNIEYRTRLELSHTTPIHTSPVVSHLYKLNEFPYLTSNAPSVPVDYSLTDDKKAQHIGRFSIVNPDGNTYEYGLPVYNVKQKDAIFSIPDHTTPVKTLSYNLDDASLHNQSGSDRFYMAEEMPAYATSYMLTGVYSADYVDVTGNGPSDDDLGYFVKFNYSPLTQENSLNPSAGYYKWRIPFSGAIKRENYEDNAGDDKAAYIYGEKEIYYLNSIETKTHFAVFELNDNGTEPRLDAYGATSENDNATPNPNQSLKPRHLKKIKLYSKQNTNVPLKTVHFNYDYSLCPNTVNSIAATKGKLTLKSLSFTYRDNDAGALSPYQFTYNTFNPSYHELLTDAWGNYNEDRSVNGNLSHYTEDLPYVNQDKSVADQYAAAWCLTKIKLPSGADINVEYESDDYKYVQNKKAMQMLEIVGIGYDHVNTTYHDVSFDLTREPLFSDLHDLVVFKLKKPTNSQAELKSYIKNMKNLYFKAFLKLKKLADFIPPNMAYDYVDGYCDIDTSYGVKPITDPQHMQNGMWTRAYLKVKFEKSLKIDVLDDGKLHPFQKAGIEYMQARRPELFYPVQGASPGALTAQLLYTVLGTITNLGQAVIGYNRYCKWMNFCNRLADGTDPGENDHKKSYIRLNTPDGFKYGGGHRVKKLHINDNWNWSDPYAVNTYGQEYIYQLRDTTSSGVAEYEPLFGGAENPLRLPDDSLMNERVFIANLKELYQETPICEGYYPGPNVGYSRVIVKSLTRLDNLGAEINKNTADGLTVSEFYTAWDFPVQESATQEDKTSFSKLLKIPFIGKISLKSEGHSQGYKIVLNDMHGKPKAVRVYPHNADLFTNTPQVPVHEVIYHYSMNSSNTALTNTVSALFPDGTVATKEAGISRDFVMDMDQQSGFTIDVGLDPNVGINIFPPAIFPNVVLNLNYSHHTERQFVNVKAIYQRAILTGTTVKNDKTETVTNNLMFDAYSGRPLLTKVDNEFKAPVYTYDIPAHWYYENMGNRSETYRNSSKINASSSVVSVSFPLDFNVGDRVLLYNTNLLTQPFIERWIKTRSGGNITLIDAKGQFFTGGNYNAMTLIEPISKNQLNTNAGTIVSLTNPVVTSNSAFFTALNAFLQNSQPPPEIPNSFKYFDCFGLKQSIQFQYDPGLNTFFFSNDRCEFSMALPATVNTTNYLQYEYYQSGNGSTIQIRDLSTGNFINSSAHWTDTSGCVPNCLDGVLHAEAYVFNDNWTYDYADFGDTFAFNDGQNRNLSYASNANPYKYGKTGQWRFTEKYLYQVERKQSTPHTDIAIDGTYRQFNWYNWNAAGNQGSNAKWTLNNKVTQYSPYGFEVENRNINNLPSATLYGFNNTVITASGANVPYDQISFQSFEEKFPLNATALKNGHLNLSYSPLSQMLIYHFDSHSGSSALKIGGKLLQIGDLSATTLPNTSGGIYHIVPGQKYVLSFWVKDLFGSAVPTITLPTGVAFVSPPEFSKEKIDGWIRAEATFTSVAMGTPFSITVNATSITDMYIDDIRIQPFNSVVQTYVYDPETLWLTAELDQENYATFYNYDESGNLVQVKKETVKGIYTVSNTRKNTKRQ